VKKNRFISLKVEKIDKKNTSRAIVKNRAKLKNNKN
jgi:hypothetical protein